MLALLLLLPPQVQTSARQSSWLVVPGVALPHVVRNVRSEHKPSPFAAAGAAADIAATFKRIIQAIQELHAGCLL
jgi:hypothetical protein